MFIIQEYNTFLKYCVSPNQIDMTLTDVDIHPNIVDDTAIVTGGYTLQYAPKENGQVEQTSGKLTLVFANEAETWRIIRAE